MAIQTYIPSRNSSEILAVVLCSASRPVGLAEVLPEFLADVLGLGLPSEWSDFGGSLQLGPPNGRDRAALEKRPDLNGRAMKGCLGRCGP